MLENLSSLFESLSAVGQKKPQEDSIHSLANLIPSLCKIHKLAGMCLSQMLKILSLNLWTTSQCLTTNTWYHLLTSIINVPQNYWICLWNPLQLLGKVESCSVVVLRYQRYDWTYLSILICVGLRNLLLVYSSYYFIAKELSLKWHFILP